MYFVKDIVLIKGPKANLYVKKHLPVLSCCQHICLYIQTHHADTLHMDLQIPPLASSLGIQYYYCKCSTNYNK